MQGFSCNTGKEWYTCQCTAKPINHTVFMTVWFKLVSVKSQLAAQVLLVLLCNFNYGTSLFMIEADIVEREGWVWGYWGVYLRQQLETPCLYKYVSAIGIVVQTQLQFLQVSVLVEGDQKLTRAKVCIEQKLNLDVLQVDTGTHVVHHFHHENDLLVLTAPCTNPSDPV
jgi:hypothetical protein